MPTSLHKSGENKVFLSNHSLQIAWLMLSRSLKRMNKLLCYKKLFVPLSAPTSCMGLSVKFFVAAVGGFSLGLGCEQSSLRTGEEKE